LALGCTKAFDEDNTPMVGHSDAGPLASFPALCDQAFGPLLRPHGFRPAEQEVAPCYSRRVYADNARYIAVTANLDPRDAPFHCVVAVGEGERQMPESDWNAVALWRLVQDQTPGDTPPGQEPYGITTVEDLVSVVGRMAADLAQYADDFLRGDLARFRRIRAEQTRGREPYTIWAPDEAGNYVSRPEPQSAALKARFSQSD
jgi:hypothetical protein